MPAKPLTLGQKETMQKILDQLREEWRFAGRGAKKQALENIGVSRKQIDIGFRDGYVKLGLVLQMLDELDVSPDDFFRKVFDFDSRPYGKAQSQRYGGEPIDADDIATRFLESAEGRMQELGLRDEETTGDSGPARRKKD